MVGELRGPAMQEKPYLVPPENQPWPVVINMPLSIMRDDPPPPPNSPTVSDGTSAMFRLSSDDGGSDENSVEDNCTPSEREREQQTCSEAFQHGQPGYIPDTISVYILLVGGNIKE